MRPKNHYTLGFESAAALLTYDPLSGRFEWKRRPGSDRSTKIFNAKYAGKTAGCLCPRGYLYIRVRGHGIFGAHRLAHLLMVGQWPEEEIDHVNGNPSDNRWSNLRPATRSENAANRGVQKNSKTGIKGVFPAKNGRFAAQVAMNGQVHKIGEFDTLEQACAARVEASNKVQGEFAR